MVNSKITSSVMYTETKSVETNDIHQKLELYQTEILGNIEIIIAIGSHINDFEEKGVIFYPIYLVIKDTTVVRIGLYEIDHVNLVNMGRDSDLAVDNFGIPLLFSFVTEEYIYDTRLLPARQMSEYDSIGNIDNEDNNNIKSLDLIYNSSTVTGKIYKIPEERQGLFRVSASPPEEIEILQKESKEDAKDIRDKYHENEYDLWIHKCLKNNFYGILDVESNGDCFFATIREAFMTIGQETSVFKLRQRVSEMVTSDMYKGYYEIYNSIKNELQTNKNKRKDILVELKEKKRLFDDSRNIDEKRKLSSELLEINKMLKQLTSEIKLSTEIKSEYNYMKDVKNEKQFKDKILKSEFWADDWVLSTIEPMLNIKLIVLSSEQYENSHNSDSVLMCGRIGDSLINVDEFNPEFYIMLEYTGNHYKLITYKNKALFTFDEIPYDVKILVVSKCLEKNSGTFSLISDFVSFQNEIPLISNDVIVETTYDNTLHQYLYDDDIVFSFNINSASKKPSMPGKGTGGETIPSDKISMFGELHGINKWRNKLSNLWEQDFILDDHKWQSVEHYYQGSKFKDKNPDFYFSFSLDSKSELSKDPDMAKNAGSNNGKHKGKLLRPHTIQPDPDFETRMSREMYKAQYAKFSQTPDLKTLLLATKSAKLTHWVRSLPNVVFNELMQIREEFVKEMK